MAHDAMSSCHTTVCTTKHLGLFLNRFYLLSKHPDVEWHNKLQDESTKGFPQLLGSVLNLEHVHVIY